MSKKSKLLVSSGTAAPFSTKEYAQTLADIKQRIRQAQVKAVLAANTEMTRMYWDMGKIIVERQEGSGWGSKFVELLSKDLQNEFPSMEGFSRTNLFRVRAFYVAYKLVPPLAGQLSDLPVFLIPWYHNVILLEKLKDTEKRLWYAQKAIEKGWSRRILEMWIESDLYKRDGKAITNFNQTLPKPDSDFAQQALKDPYIFNFISLDKEYWEREIEQKLVDHIQKFLLELGEGFSFVGRQYHLEVGDSDFYIDLLFYHLKLRCFVVVEIKNSDFKPEHAGQISFYLAAVDNLLRHPDDKPTIGLVLCKSKNKLTVEYALQNNTAPIGVASFQAKIVESLPKELKSSLPTVREIEAELEKHEILKQYEKKSERLKSSLRTPRRKKK